MPEFGQKRYEEFVAERLLSSSTKSIWDKLTKLKLKNFSNWMKKTHAGSRLVPKLASTIVSYEMAVVGSLLPCKGKSDLWKNYDQQRHLTDQFMKIERFICSKYSPNGSKQLAIHRWELFQSRNLEGELLPHTLATLCPHIKRANFVTIRDKSYVTARSDLPDLEGNGWEFEDMDMDINLYIVFYHQRQQQWLN